MSSNFTRRSLIGGAAGLTAASYSRILGANDRIHLGVIGSGDRGRYVMTLMQKDPAVTVTSLCDVWTRRVEMAREKAPGAAGFTDHRKLLETKPLDIVLIATPDHWHAETAIDAMNAGKDVYVEKPLTFRREEGPAIVRAARVNGRICQAGLQQRSGPQFIRARDEFVRGGKLGRVTYVRSWWHGGLPTPLKPEFTEKPSDLDWARYLGQVKWRDWTPMQYLDYRAFLDFGGGKITDLFTHWIDAIHMMTDNDATQAVMTAGGVYHDFKDGRDAPDTFSLTLEYRGPMLVTFDSAGLPYMPEDAIEIGGTKGRLLVNRRTLVFRPAEDKAPPQVLETINRDITIDHVQNFLDCVRTRKQPNCDAWHGHRGTQVAHLAVQSYVEKRRIAFDPDREIVH
jgi:predicted dehydrogenase